MDYFSPSAVSTWLALLSSDGKDRSVHVMEDLLRKPILLRDRCNALWSSRERGIFFLGGVTWVCNLPHFNHWRRTKNRSMIPT
jgi:hypothetical protein